RSTSLSPLDAGYNPTAVIPGTIAANRMRIVHIEGLKLGALVKPGLHSSQLEPGLPAGVVRKAQQIVVG
ncbi:MAG: hypothetical protein WCZ65_08555, partial [Lysobacteraceae bacterium]